MFARALCLAITLGATAGTATAAPPKAFTMADAIPFAPDVAGEVGIMSKLGNNASAIRDRCNLPVDIANAIAEKARGKGFTVTQSEISAQAEGPVLNVIIEAVLGLTGMWKGAKTLVLRGELREGDTVIVRERAVGIFQNSCEDFVEAGREAAADIAKWLRKPTLRARLGEA
jgi:hypothetical protein